MYAPNETRNTYKYQHYWSRMVVGVCLCAEQTCETFFMVFRNKSDEQMPFFGTKTIRRYIYVVHLFHVSPVCDVFPVPVHVL